MQTFAVWSVPQTGPVRVKREIVRHDSEREIRARFDKDKRVIVSIEPVEPRVARIGARFPEEKASFYRELALLSEQGSSIGETAESLRETFSDSRKQFRTRIMNVIDSLESKEGVARALELEPALFPDEEVSLVDAAFRRGKLPDVLRNIAEQLERDADIRTKIKSAAWYPIVLAVGAVVVLGIFVFVVLPQLRAFYHDLNITPIWPLTWVIAIEDWLSDPVRAFVCGAAISAFGLAAVAIYVSVPAVRYRMDFASFRLPTFGPLLLHRRRLRVLFAMHLMLTSDGQANVTNAAYAVAQGPVFRQALRRARDMQVSKQVRTTVDAFALATPVFTKYQIGIMRTGQTYGQLDVKVGNIIDEERKRLNTMIDLLPKKLESTFAVALTFIVGFLAYLMIIPTSYATAHIH